MTKRADEILREMVPSSGRTQWAGPDWWRHLRPFAERLARAEAEPQAIELVRQLRDALGLDNGARPESPQVVWNETLDTVRRLVREEKRIRADRNYTFSDRDAHCERADNAEAEVERLRAYRSSLPDAARKILEDAARLMRDADTTGLTDHERIDRLERAIFQVANSRREVDPAIEIGGAIGEIAREVVSR